jgi:ABC-2 type transport system permease protein
MTATGLEPATEPQGHRGIAPGHAKMSVADLPLERVSVAPTFWRGFGTTAREVWDYRELLGQLIRKELKVKYKDSVLGFFWTLLRPLLYLLVYSIAIGYFLGSSRSIPDFGVYLFSGLLAWNLFTDIVGGCTGAIVGNAGLVKKVYFPRELFPLSVVGAALVNFCLQLVVLVIGYAATRQWPHPSNFGLVLPALAVLVVFSTALGLLLAASNVYLRDVTYLVDVALLLWFWMTPIVYDWTKVHTQLVTGNHHLSWLFQLYMANPATNVVLAFQRALWPGGLTAKGAAFYYPGNLYLRLGVLFVASCGLLWLAQRLFARVQGNFAQEL